MKQYKILFLHVTIITFAVFTLASCKPQGESKSAKSRKQDEVTLIKSNVNGTGSILEIDITKGKAHNHPSFAIWLEDSAGNYVQTLFVTSAIGQGIFTYGDKSAGTWKPGFVKRPAALPYWTHKRGVRSDDGSLVPTPGTKVPDAYSGATPAGSFKLTSRTDNPMKGKVNLLFEINQPWDWNQYWTNNLYPDDADYKTSCQPAVVYSAEIDFSNPGSVVELKQAGHSHYSGKTGELFPDLSTLTTALHIADKITVRVK